MGDKLLFLKRIDGLQYDIIEEHNKKKNKNPPKKPKN
jgi:hypothetical protein